MQEQPEESEGEGKDEGEELSAATVYGHTYHKSLFANNSP